MENVTSGFQSFAVSDLPSLLFGSYTVDFSFEKVIGSYRIVKKIGKGRFGLVKLGEHLTTGVQVAIKIVDKSGLNVVESNSIKTEAEVMTCLNHPNVVRLLEVIETKYELALIMEYAAGGDLFEYVTGNQKRRKLAEKEARTLFSQVVSGLAYCHRHFVVHRDIKAENILLDGQGNVRIGDWGFSSVYHPGLTIETACGSLDYAAPEVLTGLVSYGPSVDIWALGVLLYFLLSSRLPFTAPNDFDVYQLIKKGEYKTPKGISRECKLLLKSLLNPNAQSRISITEVEKHPWMTIDLDPPAPSMSQLPSRLTFSTPSVPNTPLANNFSMATSQSHQSYHQKDAHNSSHHPPAPSASSAKSRDSSTLTDSSSHAPSTSLTASTSSISSSSTSSTTPSSGPSSTVVIKKKKRGTKEKRSISDTKLEQSLHQLKAGSGQAPARLARAGARRNATLRSEKSKLKDILGGAAFAASSDPFNTITEEVDEEDEIADDIAFSSTSSSDEENGDMEYSKTGVSPLILPLSPFMSSSSSIPSSPTSPSPLSAHSLNDSRVNGNGTSSPQSIPKASSTSRLDSPNGGSSNVGIPGFIVTTGGSPRVNSPGGTSTSSPRRDDAHSELHISGLSRVSQERSFGSDSDSPSASRGSGVSSPASNSQSPGRHSTSSQAETPGRSKRPKDKKARSFNTEKTKEELAGVSRFIILKLSANQLEQLKDMPEFEILQITKKTTLKEDTLLTVVVATRVPNARKYLKRFEQSRRLFRWNSDTHFNLRSRFRVENGTPTPTPPITPQHNNKKSSYQDAAQSPIPFSVAAMSSSIFSAPLRSSADGSLPSPATAPPSIATTNTAIKRGRASSTTPQSPTQRRAERHECPPPSDLSASSSFTYSHSQPSSASSSSSTENALTSGMSKLPNLDSPRSSDHALLPPQTSPPTARRRRKSITDNRLDGQPATSVSPVTTRSPLSTSSPNAASGAAPSSPSARPNLLRQSNPPAKLARMHSWSQSEFENAPPGTLKKQLAAGNPASPSLFKFFRKKRSESMQDSTTVDYPEETEPTTQKRASADSHVSFSASVESHDSGSSEVSDAGEESSPIHSRRATAAKIATTPTNLDVTPAPGSSPAKIASPRSSRSKHKKGHHGNSPPAD